VSGLLQTVGRDLAGLLLRIGETKEALLVAETLLARSMADWMARSHAIWSIPPEFVAAGVLPNVPPRADRVRRL
jgi:hypothetical protein